MESSCLVSVPTVPCILGGRCSFISVSFFGRNCIVDFGDGPSHLGLIFRGQLRKSRFEVLDGAETTRCKFLLHCAELGQSFCGHGIVSTHFGNHRVEAVAATHHALERRVLRKPRSRRRGDVKRRRWRSIIGIKQRLLCCFEIISGGGHPRSRGGVEGRGAGGCAGRGCGRTTAQAGTSW